MAKTKKVTKPKSKKPHVAKKAAPRPAAKRKAAPAPKAAAPTPAPEPMPKVLKLKLSSSQRKHYNELLVGLRDRLLDGINFLATNNLRNSQKEAAGDISSYGTHMADAGTDNFDREFALNLVSNEQEALYEVTEALKRLEASSYGICEICEKQIKAARLEVVPFARFCVDCQALSEKQNRRPVRAAAPTFPQFEDAEEAEAEGEEEKEKDQV